MPKRSARNNPKHNSELNEENTSKNLLGIANLILTGIIGIAVALYVNSSNQQSQRDLLQIQAESASNLALTQAASAKELAELQAELDRRAKMASLELSMPCQYYSMCSEAIKIRNLGPATATNIKVVISISQIKDIWQNSINDISAFKVETFPPSRDVIIKETSADLIYPSIEGNNSYEVIISNLSPQSQFVIKLSLSETIPVDIKEVNRKASVKCSEAEVCLGTAPLWEYLFFTHPVSQFYVSADCDNCEGTWVIRDSYFVSSITDSNALKMFGFTVRPNEFSADFAESYAIPSGIEYTPATAPIVLEVSRKDDGTFEITEK